MVHVRRGPSLFSSFLVSALTTVALFFGLREAERRGLIGSSVEVPQLSGMTLEQARDLLKTRGLLLTLGAERPDATIAAGAIIAQDPLAGSQVSNGNTVRAVVSKGPLTIPDVAGLFPGEAAGKLKAAGLQADAEPIPSTSEKVEAGRVLGTDPPGGTAVGADAVVKLVVSSGPAGKEVPKVVGQNITRARRTLEDAGFAVGTTKYGYSDHFDGGVVLKQAPEAGQSAKPGSKIDLVVNEPD